MIFYVTLFLISVLISSISQILLKKSAGQAHENKLREYMNPFVLIAYAMFFGSSLITIMAYKGVPLSIGPVLESVGYVFVAILSHFILKERIGKRKKIGLALIVLGVLIFGMF